MAQGTVVIRVMGKDRDDVEATIRALRTVQPGGAELTLEWISDASETPAIAIAKYTGIQADRRGGSLRLVG